MLTGLRPETMRHLLLGEGVFLVHFDGAAASSKEELADRLAQRLESGDGLLGATVGTGTFRCLPILRHLEEDARMPTVENTVNDGWRVRMTGTLREISPENLLRIIMNAEQSEQGEGALLRIPTALRPEHFLSGLCWVGRTGSGLMLIELTQVINTAGAVLSLVPRGEGTLPFIFEAHGSLTDDPAWAPCRLVLF